MPTIEELILGATPEQEVVDPAMAEREKQIWEKINRGPRERAKELAGEAWKERYGIDENSGKLSRVFAGLGDAGRTFVNRNNKNFLGGIAQESKARGMEEYKAEVPVLQRELGVLSQAKTAAAKIAQKAEADRLTGAAKMYAAAMKGEYDSARAKQIIDTTDPKIKKLVAEAGLIDAKTGNVNQDTRNDTKTLGLSGQSGLTAAMTGDPNQPDALKRTWADIQGLSAALKGSGVPKTPTQVPGTSGQTKYIQTDQGLQLLPVPPTSRTVMQADPTAVKANADAARSQFLGQPPAAPGVIPPAGPAPKPEPLAIGDKVYRERPQAPPRTAEFRQGRFVDTGLDKSWSGALKNYTGGEDPANLPAAMKQRFPGQIMPGMGKMTADQRIQSEFRTSIGSLSDESMKMYANDELSKSTGIPGNWISQFKGMIPDGLDMSSVKTRSQAVSTLATYILDKSGKAVTENERKILTQALPNIERDSDSTLLQKTLVIQNIARRLEWKKQMRLSDGEMESLLNTQAGRKAASTDQKVYRIVDAINKATRNGEENVTITNPAGQSMVVSKQKAMDLARATMKEDYKFLTQGLQEVFK